MVQRFVYIELYLWKVAVKLKFFAKDDLEICYPTVRDKTMRLNISFPINGTGALDTCMGKILSSVTLLAHQYCTVNTIHVPTSRQQ